MKLRTFFLPACFCATALFFSFVPDAKYFEGCIKYKVQVESYIKEISAKKMLREMGNKSSFFFKNGDYRQEFNGTESNIDYFDHSTGLYYHGPRGNDTFYIHDLKEKEWTIIRMAKIPSARKVAGYNCDELIVATQSGKDNMVMTKRYFYNPAATPIDSQWYSKSLSINEDVIYGTTKSIPLEMEFESKLFKITLTAEKIIPQSLNDEDLHLPKDAITKKATE
jgi:hypothetical protein